MNSAPNRRHKNDLIELKVDTSTSLFWDPHVRKNMEETDARSKQANKQ
jgi:hypothetical protein